MNGWTTTTVQVQVAVPPGYALVPLPLPLTDRPQASSSPPTAPSGTGPVRTHSEDPVTMGQLMDILGEESDMEDDVVTLEDLRLFTRVGVYSASAPAQCAVCQSDIRVGEVVRKLACDHRFHMTCVDRALEERPTCPMCRASIVPASTLPDSGE